MSSTGKFNTYLFKNLVWILISSWAFIGFLPPCPGTWASVEGALIFWFFRDLPILKQLLIVLGVTVLGVISSHFSSKVVNEKDPDFVVIDEVAGVWVALLGKNSAIEFVIALVLFRVIDIKKPVFVKKFEELPGGLGIMADDVVAGIITNVLVLIIVFIAEYLKIYH